MDVVHYLQLLCSNEVDIPVGGIVHTGMQNERGGYENDCMLVRQSEKRYDLSTRIVLLYEYFWRLGSVLDIRIWFDNKYALILFLFN